ncbi:MAG: DUF2478 domain-containing protein [Betaproteobacteria bacterium]|nr:DUF2478 domain-containing protein [Betaproteobacteria bacterium]MCC6246225.1 DUF2478 domain-containing protein [Rubrivivax sp.]
MPDDTDDTEAIVEASEGAGGGAAATLRAAAIVADGSGNLDELLVTVARRQQRAGRRVRGLVMTYPRGREGCACEMVLVDVNTDDEYVVSQPLGADSTACRGDAQGFARASEVLRRAATEAPDLVICNRFGRLEAEGGGFRAELLELMAQDVPLLTAVAPRYLEDWRRFTGGAAAELVAQESGVEKWVQRSLR